jgi:hypothetical protein
MGVQTGRSAHPARRHSQARPHWRLVPGGRGAGQAADDHGRGTGPLALPGARKAAITAVHRTPGAEGR